MAKKSIPVIGDNLAAELELEGKDRELAEELIALLPQLGRALTGSFLAALASDRQQALRQADSAWTELGIQALRVAKAVSDADDDD